MPHSYSRTVLDWKFRTTVACTQGLCRESCTWVICLQPVGFIVSLSVRQVRPTKSRDTYDSMSSSWSLGSAFAAACESMNTGIFLSPTKAKGKKVIKLSLRTYTIITLITTTLCVSLGVVSWCKTYRWFVSRTKNHSGDFQVTLEMTKRFCNWIPDRKWKRKRSWYAWFLYLLPVFLHHASSWIFLPPPVTSKKRH